MQIPKLRYVDPEIHGRIIQQSDKNAFILVGNRVLLRTELDVANLAGDDKPHYKEAQIDRERVQAETPYPDTRGVRIFTGDIVEWVGKPGYRGVVEFTEYGYGVLMCPPESLHAPSASPYSIRSLHKELKIVGNSLIQRPPEMYIRILESRKP